MKLTPVYINEKWGWVLQYVNRKDVLYDGEYMLSFDTKEDAEEYATDNQYHLASVGRPSDPGAV
jgi:hypothetical protein